MQWPGQVGDARIQSFLRSPAGAAGAKVGPTVRGECVALHKGRTTQVWQTSITNEAGKLCAVVTQTQLVMNESRS